MSPLDPGWHGELGRTVRQQNPPCPRLRGRRQSLVGAEVTTGLAVVDTLIEGRFADEQVGTAGELGEPFARAAVARVRDRDAIGRRA